MYSFTRPFIRSCVHLLVLHQSLIKLALQARHGVDREKQSLVEELLMEGLPLAVRCRGRAVENGAGETGVAHLTESPACLPLNTD